MIDIFKMYSDSPSVESLDLRFTITNQSEQMVSSMIWEPNLKIQAQAVDGVIACTLADGQHRLETSWEHDCELHIDVQSDHDEIQIAVPIGDIQPGATHTVVGRIVLVKA